MVLVQDLSKGPYQSGVTPGAGTARATISAGAQRWSFAIMLNDKPGSVTPVLPRQFNNRTFSFTMAELQNIDLGALENDDIYLTIVDRATVVAGTPITADNLISIQGGDKKPPGIIPVEIFTFRTQLGAAFPRIWQGAIGDNTNTLGSRRLFDNIQPNITIGPNEALVFSTNKDQGVGGIFGMFASVRGFYQEQPA